MTLGTVKLLVSLLLFPPLERVVQQIQNIKARKMFSKNLMIVRHGSACLYSGVRTASLCEFEPAGST